ncbi:MAG: hypothetical protein GX596_14915, partial [Propionibacterium sp.]|nr:hypothetical protein [Propionibacterium sp.]
METLDLEPVSFHLRGDELDGAFVVRYADGRNAFLEFGGTDSRRGPKRAARTRPGGEEVLASTNRDREAQIVSISKERSELGDVAIAARPSRPRTVYALPPGEVVNRRHLGVFWSVYAATFVLLWA